MKKKKNVWIEGKKKNNTNMDYVQFLLFMFSDCIAMIIIRNSYLKLCALLCEYSKLMFTFRCHVSNFS